MYDTLYLNNYWELSHNKQRVNYFDEFKKRMQAPLHHLVYDPKFCGAWCKIKYLLVNKPAQENGDGVEFTNCAP